MPTLEIGNRKLGYETYGTGPLALLIHGSPGNSKAWARVGERLAGRFRVVAPDLPGYGGTTPQPPGDEPDVGYACELIEGLIDDLGKPAVLAAHSYGGVVALRVALRAKAPVDSLVLFEPVALNALPIAGESEAFANAKAVFDDYIASFESGEVRAVKRMVDFWFGAGAFDRMPEPVAGYLLKETASNIKDVRASSRETYSAEALRAIRVPVEVVAGERSPDITHRIARAVAGLVASGTYTRLEGANHALTSTHPDPVAELIAKSGNQNRGR